MDKWHNIHMYIYYCFIYIIYTVYTFIICIYIMLSNIYIYINICIYTHIYIYMTCFSSNEELQGSKLERSFFRISWGERLELRLLEVRCLSWEYHRTGSYGSYGAYSSKLWWILNTGEYWGFTYWGYRISSE